MKNLFVLLFAVFLVSSCEEISPEISTGTIEGERVVLVEEFSGGKCVPCAGAAIRLAEQLVINEGKLVVVTMHVNEGGQSDPYPGAKHDFRTDQGTAVKGDISTGVFAGIPAGAVNRVLIDGETDVLLRQDKWAGNIAAQRGDTKMNMSISSDFDAASRNLTIEVNMVPTQTVTGEVSLKVLITESHIIDKQAVPESIDPSGVVEDWEHNHIFRDYITSTNGKSLGSNLSDPISETFTYTIPDEVDGLWVANHLEIVAFATEDTDNSSEVIQAWTVKILE